jgi:superoxide reductase
MDQITDHFQTADWKSEKHVPVIECPDTVRADEMFQATVTLGKEIAHPNTTEHHIVWMKLYYRPEGEKYVYEVAGTTFGAHGASVKGPNEGPVYTHHQMTVQLKISKPGMLYSTAWCNIHGLWQFAKEIKLQ